jgi:predicted metal-dependent HD superfamily phosphohydrolase
MNEWTRLFSEYGFPEYHIEDIVYNSYKLNLKYHNIDHVSSMYKYLADTNEPYDKELDYAILFHDYVYDHKCDKEKRSAEAFERDVPSYCELDCKKVCMLINSTRWHNATPETSAIIRADLHGLAADKATVLRNYANIMEESMSLYKITDKEFAKSNIEFMNGLYWRVYGNTISDPDYKDFYNKVLDGIELTRNISDLIS